MKEKIKIILLILIFLIMLVVIKMLLNYESNSRLKTEIAKENVTITEENLVLEEINSQIEEENMENNVLEVTEENFEKEVLNESKKVLVDFYAQWCGPCQVLSPIVEEVAKSNPDIKVVRVNIDDAERILKNGLYINGELKNISKPRMVIEEFANNIINKLQIEYPLSTCAIHLTGGGASIIYESIKKSLGNVTLQRNGIMANARAFKELGYTIWE